MNVSELESFLRNQMKGEYSSLTISFNDCCGSYEKVAESIDADEQIGDCGIYGDWPSEEEKTKAKTTNSVWTIQCYPVTPIGSWVVSASSLQACIDFIVSKES